MALNLNKEGADKSSSSNDKKGLNLNKSGDSSKKELNLNKSVDSNKGGLNLSKDKSQTDSNATLAENQDNEKKKSPLMLIAIIAIAALGIFWFINRSNDESPVPSVEDAPTVVNDAVSPQSEVTSDTVQTEQPIATSSNDQEAPTNAEPVNSTNSNTKINNNSSVSKNNGSLNQGTIEEKAKQVLDGVFGNGTDRKNALGAEYEAIQAKVNEMYRNKR